MANIEIFYNDLMIINLYFLANWSVAPLNSHLAFLVRFHSVKTI